MARKHELAETVAVGQINGSAVTLVSQISDQKLLLVDISSNNMAEMVRFVGKLDGNETLRTCRPVII